MAGKRDLWLPRMTTTVNLKEQLVRTTLRNVRCQGHPYVELRKDGKKLIFFCTLCLARCYGDTNLYNHLKGNTHTARLATAQVTLLKPNPWPFNDGVFFFHDTEEQHNTLSVSDSEKNKLLDIHHADADSLALVSYVENLGPSASNHTSREIEDSAENPFDSNLDGDVTDGQLVIPGVLQKDEVSDLVVRHIGVGKIGARFIEMDGTSNEIRRIWCEWLGDAVSANEGFDVITEHDFAVVTFSYNHNLGRRGLLDGVRYLLPSTLYSEAEESSCSRGRKRKSFSDPENMSKALANQDESSGEESQSSNNLKSKMLFSGNDDQLVNSRIFSSKTTRKKLRDQRCIAPERSCDICQQKLLPNKDVAALLNRRTGKLVCSSRNLTGAFHLFHISCLVQWLLLSEIEIYAKQSKEAKAKPRSRRKVKGKKKGENVKKHELESDQIYSAFCPECQGTGIRIEGNELEKPIVPLSEIFNYKIKLIVGRKAWFKRPELLENCSMGLDFPCHSNGTLQENVAALKLLHFYRADD